MIISIVSPPQRPPGPPSSSCVAQGTLIRLSDGKMRPIEQIRSGDKVLAYHNAQQQFVYAPVSRVADHGPRRIISLRTKMSEIYLTPKHRVYCRGKWTPVNGLKCGDQIGVFSLRSVELQKASVEAIEYNLSPRPVYNLYVDDACTFVSGEVVTHSYIILPNLRTSLNRLRVRLRESVYRSSRNDLSYSSVAEQSAVGRF